jgi:hypothetical protein
MQMINEVTVIYSRQLAGVSTSGRPRFRWVAQVGRVKLPAAPSLSAAKKAAAAVDDWDYAFMAVKQGVL